MPRHATLVEDDAHRVMQLVRGATALGKTTRSDKASARHRQRHVHVHAAAARPAPSLAQTKTRALMAVYGLRHTPPLPSDKHKAEPNDCMIELESKEKRRELLEIRRRLYRNHFAGLQATYGPTGRPKLETLIDAAMDAKRTSGRHTSLAVGAAVLTSANRIYTSGRLESAQDAKFDVCAERAALLKVLDHANNALHQAQAEIVEALVVCSDQRGLLPVPCGACREFLADFGDFPVFLLNAENDSRETRSFELFPLARHATYTAMATTAAATNTRRLKSPIENPPALDARDWTCERVANWVRDVVELPQYADVFTDKRVDGATLWLLTDADLQLLLGVVHPLHRRRLLLHLDRLRDCALLDHGIDFAQLADYVAVLDRDRLDVVAQLKQTFDRLDANHDGLLGPAELTRALQSLGLDGSSAVAAQQLLQSMSQDASSNGVDFAAFVQAFARLAQLPAGETRDAVSNTSVPHVDLAALRATFDKADTNKSGALDERELVTLLESLGRDDCARRAREWFEAVDSDGDARLSFAEFFQRYAQLTRVDLSVVRAAFDAECRTGQRHLRATDAVVRALHKLFPHVDVSDIRAWCARRLWAEGVSTKPKTLSYADFALASVLYDNALRYRVTHLRQLQHTLQSDALCHRSRIVQLQQSGHVRLCRHPGGDVEDDGGAVSIGERRRQQIEQTKTPAKKEKKKAALQRNRNDDDDDDGKCNDAEEDEAEDEEDDRVAATFRRFATRSKLKEATARRHRSDSGASDDDGKRQHSDEDEGDHDQALNAVEAAQGLLELDIAWSHAQLLRYLDREGFGVRRTIGKRDFTRIFQRLDAFQKTTRGRESNRQQTHQELWDAIGRARREVDTGNAATTKKVKEQPATNRNDYDAYLRSKHAKTKRANDTAYDSLRGRRRCRDDDLARARHHIQQRSRHRSVSSSSSSSDSSDSDPHSRRRRRRRFISRSRSRRGRRSRRHSSHSHSSTSTASNSSSRSRSHSRDRVPKSKRHSVDHGHRNPLFFRGFEIGDRVTSRSHGAGTLVRLYRDYFVADVRYDSGVNAKNVGLNDLRRLLSHRKVDPTQPAVVVGACVRVAHKGTRTRRHGTIKRCRTDGTYDVLANECGEHELLTRVPRAQLTLVNKQKPMVYSSGARVTVKRRHEYLRGTVTTARTNGTYDVCVRTEHGGREEVLRKVVWELLAQDEADEEEEEEEEREEQPTRGKADRPRARDDDTDDDGKANDADDAFEPEFTVGDRVEARFQGQATYFGGRVTRVHRDGACDIAYDDGDAETRVRTNLIRAVARSNTTKIPNPPSSRRPGDTYEDDFESD